MRHIRLLVEYDGTLLCGWQRQANGPTVQGHLEEALAKLLSHEAPVVGASRTDAGVHARGQVASFRTARPIPLHGIRRGLNSLLPREIAVRDAAEVPDDFHPRFSATGKHYRYTILTRPDRSPRWRDRAWHHPEPLSIEAMAAAAASLVGEHDFAAFRAAGCTAKTTTRRIDAIDLFTSDPAAFAPSPSAPAPSAPAPSAPAPSAPAAPAPAAPGPELLVIDVRGNAFLRNMVRILVGTLAEVGAGRRPPAQVAEILASRDRTRAGITAPAHGLELMEVRYDGSRLGRRAV
ncbi:MAG TPA: tRNA pseudouridine(38-40) synthase TruA [Kofleriaceae bacterium]|nr:tRNA pseudouridine(38-40) synthase TruA [Kofleriaceae bacterium]